MKWSFLLLSVLACNAGAQYLPSPVLLQEASKVLAADCAARGGNVSALPWMETFGTGVVVTTWETNAIGVACPEWDAVFSATNISAVLSADAALEYAPVEFPNGIAIPDSSATNPVYEIGVEGGAIFCWVAHASPYVPAIAESNRVAALADRSTLRVDLRRLKGVAQTNKAQAQAVEVSNTSSTAQVRSAVIDLRRELIDANDTIIELTRLVRKLLKEQNP